MKKRLLTVLLIGLILTLTFAAGVFAATHGVNIVINGKKIGLTGFVKDGQVMVPLEGLALTLGGTFEWNPENETAAVNLPKLYEPPGSDLKDSYTIKVNKINEGISILTLSGEVTNTSSSKLTSLTVYGKLLDANGQDLTRTYTYSISPTELAPGETGTFEIIFLDYHKFKDKNARYGIYVQGFSL